MECVNYVKKYAKYFTPNRKCFCRSSSISSAGGEAFFQDSNQDLNMNFCNFFLFFFAVRQGFIQRFVKFSPTTTSTSTPSFRFYKKVHLKFPTNVKNIMLSHQQIVLVIALIAAASFFTPCDGAKIIRAGSKDWSAVDWTKLGERFIW